MKNYFKLSKYLSFLLRHSPESLNLSMDKQGFVDIDELINAINQDGRYAVSRETLDSIVKSDNKGRYRYNTDGTKIKACQGHSIEWVEPKITAQKPLAFLYHGTTIEAYEKIISSGLISKMKRHAVHLYDDENRAWLSAKRWKRPFVVLKIDGVGMFSDGYEFGVSENNVWLTDVVPIKYIAEVLYEKLT